MTKPINLDSVKSALLSEVEAYVKQRDDNQPLQCGSILKNTLINLGFDRNVPGEQAVLNCWQDLFRQGLLAWGWNFDNRDAPFFHFTDRGKVFLQNLSRDPSNPAGYLAHLNSKATLSSVSLSYISEALQTYNSNCFKATAVMVGAASEALLLELRDHIVDRLTVHARPVPKNLTGWQAKRVLDAIAAELDQHVQSKSMPHALAESYEAYWGALVHQIRVCRNDAGHPNSVDPVSADAVHASLLIFPELAALTLALGAWVKGSMP